jgi:antitoxin VapB
MALYIKNPQTVQLARQLAAATGESLTEAITVALRERLARVSRRRDMDGAIQSIERIQSVVAALHVLDARPAEEILGYDDHGLAT